jgi:hypothetical protein
VRLPSAIAVQWNGQAVITPEQNRPNDRVRPEALADLLESGVVPVEEAIARAWGVGRGHLRRRCCKEADGREGYPQGRASPGHAGHATAATSTGLPAQLFYAPAQ